jgi:hypothetical protein
MYSATKSTATTIGILASLAGMEHGFFEVLQGNHAAGGLVIEAIGPAQRFWEEGTEIALTLVPNFLLTGILAISVGLAMIIWSSFFVQTRYGALVLALLAVLLFIFGGGFAPPISAILAIFTASRIGKPSPRWSSRLPSGVLRFLARSWKGSIIVVAVLYLACVMEAIFGWPLLLFFDPATTTSVLMAAGLADLALMIYAVLAGFAHDSAENIA